LEKENVFFSPEADLPFTSSGGRLQTARRSTVPWLAEEETRGRRLFIEEVVPADF